MIRTLLLASLLTILSACTSRPDFTIGGIYTIETGDNSFGIVKILAFNDTLVHLKIYKNQWPDRPSSVDISSLSMGSITDKEGFGIGHVPMDRKTFLNWKPIFVIQQPITAEELDGYNQWKSDQGGHF